MYHDSVLPRATEPRTLGGAELRALRSAREALCAAVRDERADAIEESLGRFVRAMRRADFARATMISLVAAAVDAALPSARGAARRARRAEILAHWTSCAERLTRSEMSS